ncbi:MAG: RDD family protein [Anaerolineales bacterium]
MPVLKFTGEKITNVGRRLKAFAYDYLLIMTYIIILSGINFGLVLYAGTLDQFSPFFASTAGKDMVAFLTLVFPVILYFTVQEGSDGGATWGKRKVGLRVVNPQGERLSFGKALLRSAVKFLPWQVAHTSIYQLSTTGGESTFGIIGIILTYVLVGLYLAVTLISKENRAPYDWLAGSYVIEKNLLS